MGFFDVIGHAKSAVNTVEDVGNSIVNTSGEVAHWAKSITQTSLDALTSIDGVLLDITSFYNEIPVLKKLANQKIPYVGASLDDLIQATHAQLRAYKTVIGIIDSGLNEYIQIVSSDNKLQQKAEAFKRQYRKSRLEFNKASEDFNKGRINNKELKKRLEKIIPTLKRGKEIAKELVKGYQRVQQE